MNENLDPSADARPATSARMLLSDMAPPAALRIPPIWLGSSILSENPPGAFRLAVAAVGAATTQTLFEALVEGGWLRPAEAGLATWPLAASVEATDFDIRAAWLATALQKVGIPLASRGAFADDPALLAACDWLATA